MKSRKHVFRLVCFVLIICSAAPVFAHAIAIPQANPVFIEASVYVSSNMRAEFTASTMKVCASIYVKSCDLQKKNGVNWVDYKSLTPPSYVATNTSAYGEVKNYASNFPSGGTFRLKVVFSGGGETVTRYSNSQSK